MSHLPDSALAPLPSAAPDGATDVLLLSDPDDVAKTNIIDKSANSDTNGANGVKRNNGQFVPKDPRINRKGRPRTFAQLRELARQIAYEPAKSQGEYIIINGRAITVIEAILRQWAQSKNPRLQQNFVEIAFGKIPLDVDVHLREETENIQTVVVIDF